MIEYVNGGDLMFHMQRQRKLPEEHARLELVVTSMPLIRFCTVVALMSQVNLKCVIMVVVSQNFCLLATLILHTWTTGMASVLTENCLGVDKFFWQT